jgi:hypothetical protein
MAGRTIYVKPEKEYLYDKAVKYSGQKSLSSLIEKTIDNLIQENERTFRDALMIMAADRSGVTANIGFLIEAAKKLISKELLDRAGRVLDIFEYKGLFDGIWKGPKARGGDNDWFWYVTMVEDDDSDLEEMYNMAISQEFNEMEKDYKKREELISESLQAVIFKKAQNINKEAILKEISDLDEGKKINYLINLATKLNINILKDKEDENEK